MTRERLSAGAAVCLLLAAGLTASARAGTVNWQHPATLEGDWFAPENWSSLALPTVSDSAYIDNGGTVLISTGSATACYVYAGCNVSGTVCQSGGSNVIRGEAYIFGGQTFYDGGELYLGYQAGAVGTYELGGTGALSAVAEYVGYQGSGTFRQTGGTNTVASWLCLGGMPTAAGVYELGGTAELSANAEYVGLYGRGVFTQSGGVNGVTMTLFVDGMSGLDSSYTLASGQVSSGSTYVGFGGAGTFTQSGGNHTVTNELVIGYQPNAAATYQLGGTDAILSVADEYVGYQGKGTFIQYGGTHIVTGKLSISAEPGGSGTFSLSGGSLTVGSMTNNGTFTQSGGVATVGDIDGTGTLLVGGDVGPNLAAKQIRQNALTVGTASSGGGYASPQGTTLLTAGDVTVNVLDLVRASASLASLAGGGGTRTATITDGTTLTVTQAIRDMNQVNVYGNVQTGTANNRINALAFGGTPANPSGQWDLNDGNLIIDYEAGSSPMADIVKYVKAGCSGYWTGQGIMSSDAAASTVTALGVVDNNGLDSVKDTLEGESVDHNSILIKYTYLGDNNLDGKVDWENDFLAFQNGILFGIKNNNNWLYGDYNYDGKVDWENDFLAFQNGILFQGDLLGGSGQASQLGSVPEPATLTLLVLGAAAMMARRCRPAR
jgi:hypothetical protein